MSNPIPPRKPRNAIRNEILSLGGKVPTTGPNGSGLVTRRQELAELERLQSRGKLVSRAVKTRRAADTLASRVSATTATSAASRQLDAAWAEFKAAGSNAERAAVCKRHKAIFDRGPQIRSDARAAHLESETRTKEAGAAAAADRKAAILAEFSAMPPGPERSAYFAANKHSLTT